MSQRTGMDAAIHTAVTSKKAAAIARAAAAAGAKGAALQAAKEYVPAFAKAVFCLLMLSVLIPFLIVAAIPNIYFGFDSSSSGDITAMNSQARAVTQYYREFLDFDEAEIEKLVASKKISGNRTSIGSLPFVPSHTSRIYSRWTGKA